MISNSPNMLRRLRLYYLLVFLICFFTSLIKKPSEKHSHDLKTCVGSYLINTQVDSLEKYSYPFMLLFDGNFITNGTGFLYKSGIKTFLVTSYHVCTGWDPFSLKKIINFDQILVPFRIKSSKDYKIMSLPLRAILHNKVDSFPFEDRPDLIAIEIPYSLKLEYNYINDRIDTTFTNKIPAELYSYGFPGKEQKIEKLVTKVSRIKGKYSRNFNHFDSLIHTPDYKSYYARSRIVEKSKKIYFFMIGLPEDVTANNEGGRSGSPVFGRFEITEQGVKKSVFKFMGVMNGANLPLQFIWVIKPKVVENYIKEHAICMDPTTHKYY